MLAKDWYRDWFNSPYYHKLYFERDAEEAHQFIDRLLAHFKPPKACRMIDFACGRGRHSIYLAGKGYDVTGIDLSFDNVQFAKQYENDHLHFYQHDMRLPAWINYFDYGFNFFTSFGYFYTRREHEDAMRTIANSLYPGGIILFDYLNVHYVEERLVGHEMKKIDNTVYEINRWQDDTHFYKKIRISDPILDHPLSFCERVAKMSLGDFTDMLCYQQLQVQEVFGDYQLNPYDIRKTPRMIVVARKNKVE